MMRDLRPLLRKAYRALPFKKSVFDCIKLIGTPPKAITKHLYFDGFFDVAMSRGETFRFLAHGTQIDNELYWYGLYGGWERCSQRMWVELCRDSQVIVDIGANDGLYCLAARTVNSRARIIAAEPLDFILVRLKANIEANRFADIDLVETAFSNYTGDAEMFVPIDADYVRSATVNTNLLDRPAEAVKAKAIKVQTFKSYFDQAGLDRLDLVKMDVESHEPEVLEGFGDLLGKHKPTILAEVSYKRVPDLLNEILRPYGYLYFNINENSGMHQQDSLTLSESDNFLICQPEVAKRYGLAGCE